tara:strand:+ start:100 stop:291 length:192 start_codon:yes stop_codon:yes gene_type:complete
MRKIIRKILGVKKKQKDIQGNNMLVGRKTLQDIKQWESQKNDLIIRSNFNRELYYKFLETIKS